MTGLDEAGPGMEIAQAALRRIPAATRRPQHPWDGGDRWKCCWLCSPESRLHKGPSTDQSPHLGCSLSKPPGHVFMSSSVSLAEAPWMSVQHVVSYHTCRRSSCNLHATIKKKTPKEAFK